MSAEARTILDVFYEALSPGQLRLLPKGTVTARDEATGRLYEISWDGRQWGITLLRSN